VAVSQIVAVKRKNKVTITTPKLYPHSRGKKAVRQVLNTRRTTLKQGKCSKGQQRTATLISYMLKGADYDMEVSWDWLTSGDFILMYADIYFKRYKLVVEYQGEQHYKFPNYWHKTKREFLNGKKRDKLKKQLLKEHDVMFIEWKYNEPFTERRAFNKLIRAGVSKQNIRNPSMPKKMNKNLSKLLKIVPRSLGIRAF